LTTFYSSEITDINQTVPPAPLQTVQSHGRLRIATVTYAQVANGSAGDLLQMCKLPAGRVTVLGKLCNLYHNLTTASMTLDIGWAAYTDFDGTAVAADPDGLDDGVDVDTAGQINIGSVLAAVGQIKTFESQEGVILTATFVTDVVANDVLKGYVVYVLD